jgi:hypothetical protein
MEAIERYVGVDAVAEFIGVPRAQVLRLTRSGIIRAYPMSGTARHVWKYKLSEVNEDIALLRKPARDKTRDGSPRISVAKGKNNG